jgi:hypothetical protein
MGQRNAQNERLASLSHLTAWTLIADIPHRPAIQAMGLGLLPRWDLHPLIMPAFAGCTLIVTNPILDERFWRFSAN